MLLINILTGLSNKNWNTHTKAKINYSEIVESGDTLINKFRKDHLTVTSFFARVLQPGFIFIIHINKPEICIT